MFLFGQIPKVKVGSIVHYEQFPSQFVANRNIDVWLPEAYDGKKKMDVLYMHDGQMLFDSSITWNKQSWEIQIGMDSLMQKRFINHCIIVGIWNIPKRRQEYFPEKVFNSINQPLRDSIQKDIGGAPNSDAYLHFIVKELKPFIDSAYKTNSTRAHTYIGGSSMGGLISLYALCEYPQQFSGAICLSTHWPGSVYRNTKEVPEAFANYVSQFLPKANKHRFYFDYGTLGKDAWYDYGQELIDLQMINKKYSHKNWITRKFEGADHTEKAWKNRIALPFQFMLGKNH